MGNDLVQPPGGHELSYRDDYVALRGSSLTDDQQAVADSGDAAVWMWGELYGFEGPDGYVSRPFDGMSTAGYLANLYDQFGLSALTGLNGEFIAVIYDREERAVSLCTDRLAMRDTYYTRLPDESIAFSTQIQSLSLLPDVVAQFDPDNVLEFFTVRRTFGVRTPLKGTFLIPPGSILKFDLVTRELETEQYWTPSYKPVEQPFSYFVDEFVERFRAAIAERTRPPGRYGLLLSGGSDSRLVLAGMCEQVDVTAYHMADWMNLEARTAERVACIADANFELLRRDDEYHPRVLERTPTHSNYIGLFHQAHAEGFMDDIECDVDVLFDGLVANHMFRGLKLRRNEIPIPGLGTLDLPIGKSMNAVGDYIDSTVESPPPYLDAPNDVRSILEENIIPQDGAIVHHGISYSSPPDLFVCADYVPITNKNGYFMAQSIRHHVAHCSPFVDNRLVDLALSIPMAHLLRRDLVNAALRRMAPDLAAVPHANSRIPPSHSHPRHFVEENVSRLGQKLRRRWATAPPQPHLSHHSWQDHSELVRSHPFLAETIADHESTIKRLPFLDWAAVQRCLDAHRDGADHADELYRLVTFLEMPVTRRVVETLESGL